MQDELYLPGHGPHQPETEPVQKSLFDLLPEGEKPARRVAELGAFACSNQELLATMIGGKRQVEIAQALLARHGSLDRIFKAHHRVLTEQVDGLTESAVIRIKAGIAAGLRAAREQVDENVKVINSPADAAAIVQWEMQTLEKEELWVILLNRRNQVLEVAKIYRGSVNSSQVRIAELYKPAIIATASAIIVAHNHPSGDPTPSPDDVGLTRAIVQAGKLLDIEVLDHIVIGLGRWVSLKDRGLGFS